MKANSTDATDPAEVLRLLNKGLAKEIIGVLRDRRHYFMASGTHANGFADEFLAHSNEVQGYADQFAERIVQLGGEPDFSPDGLTDRGHLKYSAGGSLTEMITEDLTAERIAIKGYRELIEYLGRDDPTTRQILNDILDVEKDYTDELATLLERLTTAQ